MAYLKPKEECDCATCPGHSPLQVVDGMCGQDVVAGGWICACACHYKFKEPSGEVDKAPPESGSTLQS